jgi:hypothetical protein
MMSYTEEDIRLAVQVHNCTEQEAIEAGYAQAVADSRAEEKAKYELIDLRVERNKKLAETDHWAYQDTPDMSQEQIEYREALRDITKTYKSLRAVVWPEKPL